MGCRKSKERVEPGNSPRVDLAVVIWAAGRHLLCPEIGLGVGWALKASIKDELANGTFYEIPINIELPKIEISLAYDKKNINKTALKFVEFLIDELTVNNKIQ